MKKIAMMLVLAVGLTGSAFAHCGSCKPACGPRCQPACPPRPCCSKCSPSYYPGQTFCKTNSGLCLPSLCLPNLFGCGY